MGKPRQNSEKNYQRHERGKVKKNAFFSKDAPLIHFIIIIIIIIMFQSFISSIGLLTGSI
jgi:capsule polysaccharide export protein KpsE/RkpR